MISKLPRIISRARILISHSWAWDLQTRCWLQLSQISLMVCFKLLSPHNPRQNNLFFNSFQQPSFAEIVSCDRYIDDWSSFFALLSTNHTPLGLVVGYFDLFDASLFTGLFFWISFANRSKTWHHSSLDFSDVSIYSQLHN